MKYRMIIMLLLMQVAIITKITAQFFGVSGGAIFTPLSTLDIRGTFGANLFKDTSSTSTITAANIIILNSMVLFSDLTGNGRSSLQIPAATSLLLNRVYIIANATGNGFDWDLQNNVFYVDLFNVNTYTVYKNTSVMIICDGSKWLQIN